MNGRNVVALAGTYAGVTAIRASQDTSDGRQGPIMSVNGGNTNHNLFTLNGSVFTHFNQTTGFNPPPPDAIQEIRIQTHNFSAEYGHTAGSQVSIVSKAGTNQFHGTAWEFHRNSALNARSFFQTRKPEQKQNQAGASARRRHHPQQAVLVRLLPAALGSRRGGLEPDGRADRCAARRQLHRAQHAAEESRQPDYQRAVHRQHAARRACPGTSSAPAASARSRPDLLQKYVPTSATGTVVTLSPAPRDHAVYMGRGDYHFSGAQPAERAFLRRPQRQLLLAGQRELRAAGGVQRREPVRR